MWIRVVHLGEWQHLQGGIQGWRARGLRRNVLDWWLVLLRWMDWRNPAWVRKDDLPWWNAQRRILREQRIQSKGANNKQRWRDASLRPQPSSSCLATTPASESKLPMSVLTNLMTKDMTKLSPDTFLLTLSPVWMTPQFTRIRRLIRTQMIKCKSHLSAMHK